MLYYYNRNVLRMRTVKSLIFDECRFKGSYIIMFFKPIIHALRASVLFITILLNVTFYVSANDKTFVNIEWIQLIPADDLAALMNPPESIAQIEDGAENDNIDALSALSQTDENALRFKQALKSSRVIEAFNDADIRLPGFIVPLESDENQRVTQFFIVPYFGACLHMPPPPPNQIIFATHPEGIKLDVLYDPFWFEGTLTIDNTENELGASAYSMQIHSVVPYED